MCIFNEFEEKLVKIGCDVNALKLGVVILVHQDEVGVEFYAPVFSHDDAHLVFFLRYRIVLAHRSVLEKFGNSHR